MTNEQRQMLPKEALDGILLIDKPANWTSFDVVAKIRGILRQQAKSQELGAKSDPLTQRSKLSAHPSKVKVGHTGTLDPFATGLLIIVVGSYTKKAEQFSKLDKVYEAEITLGSTSTTGDTEGEIVEKSDKKPTQEEIESILSQFTGEIQQIPHKFSAIKIDGQRAYKLAREGKEVKLEPRKVTVYRLQVTDYDYPKLNIVTEVSSGTYIRSLAEDIGEKLSIGAYLTSLRRTKVGKWNIEDAQSIAELDIDKITKI
jgi:tRNA pseudouridine55 synthase